MLTAIKFAKWFRIGSRVRRIAVCLFIGPPVRLAVRLFLHLSAGFSRFPGAFHPSPPRSSLRYRGVCSCPDAWHVASDTLGEEISGKAGKAKKGESREKGRRMTSQGWAEGEHKWQPKLQPKAFGPLLPPKRRKPLLLCMPHSPRSCLSGCNKFVARLILLPLKREKTQTNLLASKQKKEKQGKRGSTWRAFPFPLQSLKQRFSIDFPFFPV